MSPAALLALMSTCAPQVAPANGAALIAVESSFNPHAIGVVHGALDRQPTHRDEALATARMLEAQGWNFSVGLAQINTRNFERLGLTLESAFDPCANLAAMQAVLSECFVRAETRNGSPQRSLRKALSCYYSGNFLTGFEHGYVRKIVRSAMVASNRSASSPSPAKDLP